VITCALNVTQNQQIGKVPQKPFIISLSPSPTSRRFLYAWRAWKR